MVFKRRNPRSIAAWAQQLVYPTGGFLRAIKYMVHRMRRLPDEPHRVARGVFAGTFVNFPPIFGIQFISAAALAWAMRGNIIAALLCTFLSNPITTPVIAVVSMETGYWLLGIKAPLEVMGIVEAFGNAGVELWRNAKAVFTSEPTEWASLIVFFKTIYLPYLVGSIIPGLICSTVLYYLTTPLVLAYQKIRAKRTQDRIEKRRRLKAAVIEARQKAELPQDDAAPLP